MQFTGSKTAQIIIATDTQLSAAVDLGELRLAAVAVPAGWTAAGITFQASFDGQTWFDLYDSAGAVTLPQAAVAAGRLVVVDPAVFFGIRYLKLRSTAPQAANRDIILSTTPR